MNFPLSDLEKHVHKTILTRGKEYFKTGAVIHLEEIDKGQYSCLHPCRICKAACVYG